MSHFYGRIPISNRKTPATACAGKASGLKVTAASYKGCVSVELWYNAETQKDEFRVSQQRWLGSGITEEIASGIIGEPTDPLGFAKNL